MSEDQKKYSLINLECEGLGDTVKEVYQDGAKPFVQAAGKVISLAPRGIRALLSPFEKWVVEREKNLEEVSNMVAEKLKDVPKEKITTPDSYIAVPALQAISYTYDSQELRKMFANLLANAMNIDTKHQTHPSFIEIIKQLSPLEAKILNETKILNGSLPCCEIRYQNISSLDENMFKNIFHRSKDSVFQMVDEGYTILDYFVIFDFEGYDSIPPQIISASIVNFQRLGLCSIPEGVSLTNDDLYKTYENHLLLQELQKTYDKKDKNKKICLIKKAITCTEFGKLFYEVCIK